MKLVYTSLFEFERGRDPKTAMGIGTITMLEDRSIDASDRANKFLEMANQSPGNESKFAEILDHLLVKHDPENYNPLSIFNERNLFNWLLEYAPEVLRKHKKYSKKYLSWVHPTPKYFNEVSMSNYYDLVFDIFTLQAAWKLFLDQGNLDGIKMADDRGANIAAGRILPYIVAIDKKDIDFLNSLLDKGISPATGYPRQGRTENNYPIRRAATQGWAEGVERLLKDHRVNPADHNNSALSGAEKGMRNYGKSRPDYEKIVRMLLDDREVWKAIHAGKAPKALLKRLDIKV